MSNKIITKQKSNKTTKVKLLGITIYKKTKKPDLEKIYIIGIPFYAKKKRQSSEKEYFLGIRISKSLNKDILLEEIKKIKILVDVKISKLEKKINCQNLHAKTFTKYKNIFQKKELVIVGAGPSLSNYIPLNNKIHILVGCDCNLNGYWNGQPMKIQKDILANCLEHNKRGWSDFKKFINYHYPDIEIISINPVGLKGLFKDVYTQEYLNEHPEIDRNKVSILEES